MPMIYHYYFEDQGQAQNTHSNLSWKQSGESLNFHFLEVLQHEYVQKKISNNGILQLTMTP